MKVKDIPIFKQKTLDMLPITQAEVWKKLGINSRDGSELISIMLEEHLIKRTKQYNTFLVERLNGDRKAEKKKKSFLVLFSKNGKFSPCCGCLLDCNALTCKRLHNWLIE